MWYSFYYPTEQEPEVIENTIYKTIMVMKEVDITIENPEIISVDIDIEINKKEVDLSVDIQEELELILNIEKI